MLFLLSAALAAPPSPDADLSLDVTPLRPGEPFELVADALPGERVTFLASIRGDGGGPCPGALGGLCVQVQAPLVLGTRPADAGGMARLGLTVPADLAVDTVWFQAAVAAGADSRVGPVVAVPVEVAGAFDPEAVAITMELDLVFTGAAAGLACLFADVCDCTATYTGDGVRTERDGDRFTFDGTWVQARTTCSDAVGLDAQVWVPADGRAFHSFTLAGGELLTTWVAHPERDGFAVDPAAPQWALDTLAEPWVGEPIRFGGETVESEAGVTATVTSAIEVRFE